MFDSVVPAGVCCRAWTGALPDDAEAWLSPDEASVVARAVRRRRQEYATTRHLAHLALEDLGRPAASILPGPRGAPAWPAGVLGSMTHCAAACVVAVVEDDAIGALGIDAEPDLPLPDGVLERIALADEVAHLDELADDPSVSWDRLLFCAKEAVYKAWSAQNEGPLGFRRADIRLARDGTVSARLIEAELCTTRGSTSVLDGAWVAADGHLGCVVWWRRSSKVPIESATRRR